MHQHAVDDGFTAHIFVITKNAGGHRLEIENVDDEKPARVEMLQGVGKTDGSRPSKDVLWH